MLWLGFWQIKYRRKMPWMSPDDYLDFRERNQTLELSGMYRWEGRTRTDGDQPVRLRAQLITEDVLGILGNDVVGLGSGPRRG